ncbi:hypothetical protein F4776DRAFT_651764 [Hypoxylon sp. NC0597]|nr:hypothetical protein F4776DRAFT_651764 [Hypoxylon sp. NC0597]
MLCGVMGEPYPRPEQMVEAADLFDKLNRAPHIAMNGGVRASGKTITNGLVILLDRYIQIMLDKLRRDDASIPPSDNRPTLYICSGSNVRDTYDNLVERFPTKTCLNIKMFYRGEWEARNDLERSKIIGSIDELKKCVNTSEQNSGLVIVTSYTTLFGRIGHTDRRISVAKLTAEQRDEMDVDVGWDRNITLVDIVTINPDADIDWGLVVADDCDDLQNRLSYSHRLVRALKKRWLLLSSSKLFSPEPRAVLAYLLLAPSNMHPSPPPLHAPGTQTIDSVVAEAGLQVDNSSGVISTDSLLTPSTFAGACDERHWDPERCGEIMLQVYEKLLCRQVGHSTHWIVDEAGNRDQINTQVIQLKIVELDALSRHEFEQVAAVNRMFRLPAECSQSLHFDVKTSKLLHVSSTNAGISKTQQYNPGEDSMQFLYRHMTDSPRHPEPESRAAWCMWHCEGSPVLSAILEDAWQITSQPCAAGSPVNNLVVIVPNDLCQLIVVNALKMLDIRVISIVGDETANDMKQLGTRVFETDSLGRIASGNGVAVVVPASQSAVSWISECCTNGIIVQPPETYEDLEGIIDVFTDTFTARSTTFNWTIYTVKDTPQHDALAGIWQRSVLRMLTLRESPILSELRGPFARLVAHEIVRCRFGLPESNFIADMSKACRNAPKGCPDKDSELQRILSVLAQLTINLSAEDNPRREDFVARRIPYLRVITTRGLLGIYCAMAATEKIQHKRADELSWNWDWIIMQPDESNIKPEMISERLFHIMGQENHASCGIALYI